MIIPASAGQRANRWFALCTPCSFAIVELGNKLDRANAEIEELKAEIAQLKVERKNEIEHLTAKENTVAGPAAEEIAAILDGSDEALDAALKKGLPMTFGESTEFEKLSVKTGCAAMAKGIVDAASRLSEKVKKVKK